MKNHLNYILLSPFPHKKGYKLIFFASQFLYKLYLVTVTIHIVYILYFYTKLQVHSGNNIINFIQGLWTVVWLDSLQHKSSPLNR